MIELNMGQKIKALRKEHGLTLEQVGNAVGVGKSTVRKWETGIIANMRRDKIAALSKVLHTTPAYLMGWESETDNLPSNMTPIDEMNKIPLVGRIACGTPILAEENIEDYVDLPSHIHADFALECKGDSMINAGIYDGDIVYIKKQPFVENGQIAAVLLDGEEATLKRFYKNNDTVTLLPENTAYSPMTFVGEEINNLKIEGLAVAFTHKLV